MQLTRARFNRFVSTLLWLIREIMAVAPWRTPACVVSGVAASLLSLATFAGTIQIVGTIVQARIGQTEAEIPLVSDLLKGLGVGSSILAGIVAIGTIYVMAMIAHALNRSLTATVVEDSCERVVAHILRQRVIEEANRKRDGLANRFQRMVANELDRLNGWIAQYVRNLLGLIQAAGVCVLTFGLLTYFVPVLIAIMLPLFAIFVLIAGPTIYRRRKRTAVAAKNRKQAMIDARKNMQETFEEAINGRDPDRFVEHFFWPRERYELQAAELAQRRVEDLNKTLQLTMFMVAFFLVLAYLTTQVERIGLASGGLIQLLIILFTLRFALVYFNQSVDSLLRLSDNYFKMKEVLTKAGLPQLAAAGEDTAEETAEDSDPQGAEVRRGPAE